MQATLQALLVSSHSAGMRLIVYQTFNLVKSPPRQINKLCYKYPAGPELIIYTAVSWRAPDNIFFIFCFLS